MTLYYSSHDRVCVLTMSYCIAIIMLMTLCSEAASVRTIATNTRSMLSERSKTHHRRHTLSSAAAVLSSSKFGLSTNLKSSSSSTKSLHQRGIPADLSQAPGHNIIPTAQEWIGPGSERAPLEPTPFCRKVLNTWLSTCVFTAAGPKVDGPCRGILSTYMQKCTWNSDAAKQHSENVNKENGGMTGAPRSMGQMLGRSNSEGSQVG
jgi:hypothetical protein